MIQNNILKLSNLIITYIVVNLIIILLSCNSSSNTNIYEEEKYISPIEILNKSSKSIEKLNSFYLDLSHENGFTFISTNLSLISAKGYIINSEELNIEFSGLISGIPIKSGVIVTNQSTYLKNPLNEIWEKIPENLNPINFFDPSEGISNILNDISKPQITENTTEKYVINGILPNKSLASIVPEPVEEANIEVLLTIRKSDFLLSKAILIGKINNMEQNNTKRIIKLSKFNEIISISLPNQ
ncbi:MAG: hypothetical protein CL766_04095 [Chloroflexi bacterium]|nr:hypothetical protein [Chloroflexota bacterium]|tara:strand:+ start:20504 stop:21229 length:726 start_codon:yes stop_codon:yes gene_type:complete